MISYIMIGILGVCEIDYVGSGKPSLLKKLVAHDSTCFAGNHWSETLRA